MSQLWIYVLQGLFLGICDKIDTAFGNSISIDAICVLSAYTVITWVTYCVYQLGSYAYRVQFSKEKNCMVLSLITSVMLGVFVFSLSDYFPRLYTLTQEQYALFTKCLKAHAVSLPALALGDFLHNYVIYKKMNRLMWISNVVFYVLLISTDAIVIWLDAGLEWIIICTGISYLVYDVIMLWFSKIMKVHDRVTIKSLKGCLQYGSDIVLDRLMGKVATIIFNVYASKLGTEIYAIHCVCYSLGTFTENVTNSLYQYEIVHLHRFDTIKDRYKECFRVLKENAWKLCTVGYLAAFCLLPFVHGDVSIRHCLVPTVLYCVQVLPIQLYEALKGFLTSIKRTKVLRFAGLVGILVRIPVTLVSYYCGLGLWGFAIASAIDFLCRGVYFYLQSKRILQEVIPMHLGEPTIF